MSRWIPKPFDLLEGNPFEYSENDISVISGTEAFETDIKRRDRDSCVVCGHSQRRALDYCYIIPKVEDDTWEEMKDAGFVPEAANSVEHEVRNGIRLCKTHHTLFDTYCYYIRWMPEKKLFVLINYSRVHDLEVYHGKAINLDAGDDQLPFHGAFLFHEMRVRGFWPLRKDRAIPLPIPWVDWLTDDGDDRESDDGGGDGDGDNEDVGGCGGQISRGGQVSRGGGGNGHNNETSAPGKVFIPSNPFTNPTSLKALKQSFAKQPNWKAAVKEGTTWEGNADENAAKWRNLNRIEP